MGRIISPRMKLELTWHAELIYDDCFKNLDSKSIEEFCAIDFGSNLFIPSDIKALLPSSETWTLGYLEIFNCIAACLNADVVLTEDAVMRMLNKRPCVVQFQVKGQTSRAVVMEFLGAGGSFVDAMKIFFEFAKYQNTWDINEGLFTEMNHLDE